jgi:hypothetical protein
VTITYRWECKSPTDPNGNCSDQDGVALINYQSKQLRDNPEYLIIKKNRLRYNSTYLFTLYCQAGDKKSSYTMTVKTDDRDYIPVVAITATEF